MPPVRVPRTALRPQVPELRTPLLGRRSAAAHLWRGGADEALAGTLALAMKRNSGRRLTYANVMSTAAAVVAVATAATTKPVRRSIKRLRKRRRNKNG